MLLNVPGRSMSLLVIHQDKYIRTERHVWRGIWGGSMGWRWGYCRIVGENGGWRVRGMIEISVRLRTLINSKFQILLVKK